MRPYSIRAPEFDPTSGGIRVMYGLYGWLLAKGQIAHINAVFENKDFVGIYPEIYHGNDLQANTVVRYLLNKPGVMGSVGPDGSFRGGPTIFPRSDRIYAFSELFNTEGCNKDHILFLPILNLHIFKDQKKARTKKAVFVGKGQNTGLHPQDCVPIDRKFAQDQQALADLLNECEVMYQYDPVSAMSEIARLCGCRVVMLQEEYSKDDYRKYEPGINGISWGLNEEIRLEVDGFRQHYIELRQKFSKQLDIFIDQTQS